MHLNQYVTQKSPLYSSTKTPKLNGKSDRLLVVPSPNASLKIEDFSALTLDNPMVNADYETAKMHLFDAADHSNLLINIFERKCAEDCNCYSSYQSNDRFRWKFFCPNVGG